MKRLLLALGITCIMVVPTMATPYFDPGYYKTTAFFQSSPVTGKVTNDQGEPSANVTVQVKGTGSTTLTGPDGSFQIAVPSGSNVLVFSYVGMEDTELNIGGRTTVAVQLKAMDNTLTDVVVVGYGTQRKVNLTGSVSTVNGQKLTERPAPNAANLFQGRVTGLQVTQPSAEPGRDNPNLLIRGRGSFGGSSVELTQNTNY